MERSSPRVMEMRARLEEALAGIEERRAGLDRARASLADAETSSTSRDHVVTVTVSARGVLQRVKFNGTRYRSMPAAELENSIVEAVAAARAEMAGRVTEVFRPFLPEGSDLPARMAGSEPGRP
ncbi:hypothetical protein GCM10009839_32580 [Catenulispora yoronensis]|uniref:YbaB/EbfC family nucleoid-associated protein n=1 Tax=Catenulispora yoronensis TaxID=450799 RepID=A0ABN2U7P6_9ACTN